MGRMDEALEKIIEADAFFTRLHPTAAVEKYRAAEILFRGISATDSDGPLHLSSIADSLKEAGEMKFALKFNEKALALYERYHPAVVEYAECLSNSALLYEEIGNESKTMEKYAAAADAQFRRFPNSQDRANNLWSWGGLLANTQQEAEAIPKVQQAHALYEQLNQNEDVIACEKLVAEMIANLGMRASNVG